MPARRERPRRASRSPSRRRPTSCFLDIKMPQMDGLEVLKRLKERDGSPPVVILSGHGTVKTAVEAVKLGAFDFIEKPPESERILLVARNALGQKRLRRGEPPAQADASTSATAWWARARPSRRSGTRCAAPRPRTRPCSSPARAAWARSSWPAPSTATRLRKDEAFVQVNCAAIPEELIESELFGHEKGSFTGATEKQIGKFELAHKGTIFLDEVGRHEPAHPGQGPARAAGGRGRADRLAEDDPGRRARDRRHQQERSRSEIEKGRLPRGPLLPPLGAPDPRARRCASGPRTCPPLVEHFVRQFCAENNFRPKAFTPAAIEALRRHPWRGNVRELKNAVERLLIMVEDDEIRPEHLGDVLRRAAGGRGRRGGRAAPCATSRSPRSAPSSCRSSARARWNISATAAAIGTPRSNLYKKLEAYGISQEKDG